ncbi:MAG: WD40/YVTN/BNR-like repeat-containing protein, partial [Planctomycetaceae bacterium]
MAMTRAIRAAGACAALTLVVAAAAVAQVPAEALGQDLQWRNIGPANMAGRVTDIEAVEADPAIVYVGAASGGVWKSTNAGTTWTPIFEDYGTANIGDIAIFQPNPDIVWVGTGESCVRNSVGWGDGVYKSTDGGKTFANVGLRDSHHIGEVVTHPTDPDIVYVASQGHLWAHTGEHGLFRTQDGGRTWERLSAGLPDDGKTGATDLVMDPSDPNVLYAAFWERLRQPYRFDSGGPNGGIFKSTDGGDSWTELTNGLPEGPTGKIGLSIFRQDPRILVAIVEHGYQPEEEIDDRPNPEYTDLSRLGSGIYRSEDGGASWTYINRYNNRPFYYSHIYIDPNDDQRVYVLAGSANISDDGGRTFSGELEGIAGDFHALWIDPANSDRYYVGDDKGAYVTYDRGANFIMFDNMDIGQFYAVTADNRDPYWVYGGLQDNGNWGGPSNSRDWNGILNDHWFKFHSGDGFHTTVDPNDWRTVYTESQGGNIRRFDVVFRQVGGSITPDPSNILNFAEVVPGYEGEMDELPRDRFRFNWSAALTLSPHDSRTVMLGGNHLFRSRDRGESWRIISPDLTTNDPVWTDPESGGLTRDVTDAETHSTIITISESPVTPGVIWVGTDDG